MNKEISLKERIEKLYESGYVNEFNYLENQLQEARCLVVILQKQTEEKDKEIDRLNNVINELEEWLSDNTEKMHNISGDDFTTIGQAVYQEVLDKLKGLKEKE